MTPMMHKARSHDRTRSGMALAAVMLVLGALSILIATAYLLTTTNTGIARNQRDEVQALYQAEAGLSYAKARIQALVGSTFSGDGFASNIAVNFVAPSGYTFDTISNVAVLANGAFLVQVVGRSASAYATVEGIFNKPGGLTLLGVFGNTSVQTANGSSVYSYRASQNPVPTIAGSAHQVGLGSNQQISIGAGSFIDGSLMAGAVGNVKATINNQGTTFGANVDFGAVPSDPFGLLSGGPIGTAFTAAQTVNNNAAIGVASGGTLSGNKTIPPGDYYFNWINLSGNTVVIDNRSNRLVRFFLTGPEDTHVDNNSRITLMDMNQSKNFQVYTKGTKTTHFDNSSFVPGFWYAPTALFTVDNGGQFDGIMWGGAVTILGNSKVFVDLDAQNVSLGTNVTLLSWKEVRN
jgi:Tfp pilus assembly protein PilX